MSAFIEDRKAAGFAVELTCRTLGVSVSAHYRRRSGPPSTRCVQDAVLLEQIVDLHAANYYAYGYRRCGWRSSARASMSAVIASGGSCA